MSTQTAARPRHDAQVLISVRATGPKAKAIERHVEAKLTSLLSANPNALGRLEGQDIQVAGIEHPEATPEGFEASSKPEAPVTPATPKAPAPSSDPKVLKILTSVSEQLTEVLNLSRANAEVIQTVFANVGNPPAQPKAEPKAPARSSKVKATVAKAASAVASKVTRRR